VSYFKRGRGYGKGDADGLNRMYMIKQVPADSRKLVCLRGTIHTRKATDDQTGNVFRLYGIPVPARPGETS